MKDFILFMGPPGCGKGTQSDLLSVHHNYHHISTGAVLRREVAAKTSLGHQVEQIISTGQFISDEMIQDMLVQYLSSQTAPCSGYILDGFPRTVAQAEWLTKYLQKTGNRLRGVLYFHVNQEILLKRLTGRFTCARCGATYNDYFSLPREDGKCDRCGCTEFLRRTDDNMDRVQTRLSVYAEKTAPLIEYYESAGLLLKIDANRSVDEIAQDVFGSLV